MQSTTFISRTRINRARKRINSCLWISYPTAVFLLMTCSSSDDSSVASTALSTPPPPSSPSTPGSDPAPHAFYYLSWNRRLDGINLPYNRRHSYE